MALIPPKRRDYAVTPAIGAAAVATLTVLFGLRLMKPRIYLVTWFELIVWLATFGIVAGAVYRWRVSRREADPAAYTVRDPQAWSLEEDWRHQLGLWAIGLLAGGAVLLLLRYGYGLGWLRFAWP